MDEVKKELYQIKEELQRISKVDEVDIEKLAPLRTIIEMMQGFQHRKYHIVLSSSVVFFCGGLWTVMVKCISSGY